MKRCWLIFAALLLAACNLSNNVLPDADWCYQWDFRASDAGFTIAAGNRVDGRGIVSDNDGYLVVHYTAGSPVTPNGIVVVAGRAENAMVPIHLTVTAMIFGTRFGTIGTDVAPDAGELVLRKAVSGASGDTIIIEGYAVNEAVQLEVIQVRGVGTSPFGSSNCSSSGDGTVIDVQSGDWLNQLHEADQELADANRNLTAPNGTPLLPNANLQQLFGYAKWIVSPTAGDQLAGPFAPIMSGFGILLTLEVALMAIYISIYVGVYIARWIIWLIKLLMLIIQTVKDFVGGIAGFVLKFIGG